MRSTPFDRLVSFVRRSQLPVSPEMTRLQARAAHLRGEIFYHRPALTQHLRWELAGLERRIQEMEASARAGAGGQALGASTPLT